MDEMKQDNEIDSALRAVARQRDKRLGKRPILSPERQAVLTNSLVREFPVEAALRRAALKRDRLLNLPGEIPASAESARLRCLAAAGPALDRIQGRRIPAPARGGPEWLRFFRWPRNALLTTCVLVAVAIICFGKWGTPSGRNAENFPHAPRRDTVNIESPVTLDRFLFGRAELFTRAASIPPFDLNTNQPASLQASFFANSTVSLVDRNDGLLGLRLDLPVRASFVEDSFARIP
jgi:hypothetical protein